MDAGRRLRVLAFIDSLTAGGAERSLVALAPQYGLLGVEFHVAHLRVGSQLAPELESAGAVVHHLAGPERRIGWTRRARRLIRDLEPDLVHTSLFEGDLVGRAAATFVDVPVVSSFVTDSYGPEHVDNPEYRWWKVRAAQLADMALARRVDRFHSVSENAAALMSRRLRIPRARIDVVARGRDPEALGTWSEERRLATRERIGLEPDRPLVFSAGRHYHVKGLDQVVAAFSGVMAAVPEARLLIAGRQGPATEELLALAGASGIESAVEFAGYRADVPDLLVAADVFVLPSRAEGSPGALIEAMALRAPAVVSDIPSTLEVIGSPPAATVVPLEDPAALADGIVELLNDERRRADQADRAYRRFLDHYTTEAVARDMMLVYARAAAAKARDDLRERFEKAASVVI